MISPGGTEKILVKTFGDVELKAYTQGSTLKVQTPTESEGELNPDQQVAYYFKIPSISKFEDYVKNPESQLITRAENQLRERVDTYILGLYADVGSGNRVGTDYVTGSVTIAVTTGVVTGSPDGTIVFISSMAGKGLKATGHTKWYRIKTYSSATQVIIENDSDDDDSAYDGGTITDASYTIEANTVLTVTTSNIIQYIDNLAEKLDENKIPKEDRWLVVNAKIAGLIRRASAFTPAVESAYVDVVQKGLIGWISGLEVYENQQIAGNNSTGYYIVAGHKSAITFAMEFKETGIEPLIGDFGQAYKGLVIYGAKILDERRKAFSYLWCIV